MSNFKTRVSTAIVFGIIMLTGLFLNEISFFILFFIIGMGCLWEFLKLMVSDSVERWAGMVVGSVLLAFSYFTSYNLNNSFYLGDIFSKEGELVSETLFSSELLILILLFTPLFLLIYELFKGNENPFQNVAKVLLAIFYALFPFCLLSFLSFKQLGWTVYPPLSALPMVANASKSNFTSHIVAGILFLNWANDSGAYLVGSRIGKTPLFPRISPKKTWEGTVGGALVCLGIGYVLSLFFKELGAIDWMILGLIVGIFGTLGDLVESMLKRSVGVKDSGSFMPGHGGFLDRFDAFIFSIPFAYLYLTLFK